MKVYVCYSMADYEGCSIPLIVFDSKEKADAWIKEQKVSNYEHFDFEELEVE